MRKITVFTAFAAMMFWSCWTIAATAPVTPPDASHPDFSRVQDWLEHHFEAAAYDGLGMLVWKDGKVVYERYFGNYDENTSLAIASSTKWLSGAALMTLVDDGLISLDDPLSKYLPEFNGEKARITIRQAFSHTSALGKVDGDGAWRRSTSTAEYARQVAKQPLEAEPGTELRYASESMQVVGAIAEQVTGKRWEVLFHERIAGPLTMSNTGYSQTGEAINPMLAGWAHSTVRDFARFLEMLIAKGRYDGHQVLSAQAIRVMHANQVGDVPITQGSRGRRASQSRYGIGNWVDETDAKGDSNLNSSPGALGMRPWIDWDDNYFAIYFIDRRTAKNKDYRGNIRELIDLVDAAVNLN
jgi:CubicO group peptidase (beta-lactamase class C family)